MKRLILPVVVAAVLVATVAMTIAACGGSAASGHTLDGTSWRLAGWTLDSLAPDQFTITAAFAGGRISGSSAVNTYGGAYSTGAGGSSGGAFSVGQLASTEMAGPEPAMRAEGAYNTLLQQARSFKLAGNALTLYDANGNESLTFARTNL
jgi:heat shock protein HslJ